MKKIITILAALALSSAIALSVMAGPFLSLGLGWYESQTIVVPGFGLKGQLSGSLGLEGGCDIASFNLDTGGGWRLDILGITDLCITTRLPSPPDGPFWGAIFGVGIPGMIAADAGSFTVAGAAPGVVFGVASETADGVGVMIKTFYSADWIGFGFIAYLDLLGYSGPQTGSE